MAASAEQAEAIAGDGVVGEGDDDGGDARGEEASTLVPEIPSELPLSPEVDDGAVVVVAVAAPAAAPLIGAGGDVIAEGDAVGTAHDVSAAAVAEEDEEDEVETQGAAEVEEDVVVVVDAPGDLGAQFEAGVVEAEASD